MIKKITCIECPVSCALTVDIENCKVVKIGGNKCPKAEKYAAEEIENPMRILTSTVLTEGLVLKMLPVRTDKPIPKAKMMEAMEEIRNIRLNKIISSGDIIKENFLNLGVNLVATRSVTC